jgi:hypothetical protein
MSGDRNRRINRWCPERHQDPTFGERGLAWRWRSAWEGVGMALYLAVMLGFRLV